MRAFSLTTAWPGLQSLACVSSSWNGSWAWSGVRSCSDAGAMACGHNLMSIFDVSCAWLHALQALQQAFYG
jgi:hypothetical protein